MKRRDLLKQAAIGSMGLTGANIFPIDSAEGANKKQKTRPSNYCQGKGEILLGGLQFSGLKGKKQRNLQTMIRMTRRAAARGAQIVMTPECALSGFMNTPQEKNVAEPIPGPITEKLGFLAKELDIYILVGMPELRDGQFCNAMAVIDRKGSLMGVFRKVHLNKYESPVGWRNGSEFPVWRFQTDTGVMTAGIMICYDRELPESARLLMLKDADVIFNPLATGCPTVPIHRCLLRTRAFENTLYILMVNHAAPNQNGHSMGIDYNGSIVTEAGEKEQLLFYKVNLDTLNNYRKTTIYGKHNRRPALYGLLCDPEGQIHSKDTNLPPLEVR